MTHQQRITVCFMVLLLVGLCSYACSFVLISRVATSRCSELYLSDTAVTHKDRDLLNKLLEQAAYDSKHCQVEPLSGPGFCNALYKVQCGKKQMIGKLFSNLAKRRMTSQQQRHHDFDWMAAKRGLGPNLFASTDDGILMECLLGTVSDETMVHGSSEWIAPVATQLAEFHFMETPNPPNVLWSSMDAMMDMMKDTRLVEDEVLRQRASMEPLEMPTVLGHGDLKPSNIIQSEGGPRFIDLEIAGMHYRGFDLAKLFRTSYPTAMSERNFRTFLECYLNACPAVVTECDKELDLLRLEAKLIEPLTWLEAAVFFTCSASMDPANKDKWDRLARDRMESYEKSTCGIERYIDEYRAKR